MSSNQEKALVGAFSVIVDRLQLYLGQEYADVAEDDDGVVRDPVLELRQRVQQGAAQAVAQRAVAQVRPRLRPRLPGSEDHVTAPSAALNE